MSDSFRSTDSDHEQRTEKIRQIANDCLLARAQGEVVSDESLIQAHPDLMPELADELNNLRMIEQADHRADQSDAGSGLHIRCPHCHHPVELVDDASLSEVECPSCGSQFSLVDDADRTYQAHSEQTIGHFQLLDKVGMGAFGSVWSARDMELDRQVAVKIPRKGQLSVEDGELFIREARAAAQLKHPHIVSVLEVGRHEDRIYIVTEFVQGLDLADWLTDQQATPHEAAELCATVADALQHAHDQGVIHRDLKPSNIMLDTAGDPHLMDFGLAKRESGEMTMTIEGKLLGTPAYMSPEQARGAAHDADARSDVYSLGVILFELLTGERPFRGSTRMLLHQVLVEDAPSPRKLNGQISKDLETICLKCLEKAPGRRYQSAAEMRGDLQRYLRGEPVSARPISKSARIWRWCKRKPVVAGLSAAVAVLLLILAIAGPIVASRQASLRLSEFAAHEKTKVAEQNARDAQRQAEEQSDRHRRLLYTSDMRLALNAWEETNVQRCVELLDRHRPPAGKEDLRGFEWNYIANLCQRSRRATTLDCTWGLGAVAFSPDDKTLATVSGRSLSLWDLNGDASPDSLPGFWGASTNVSYSPDGKLLAVLDYRDDTVVLWDIQSAKQVYKLTIPRVFDVAFSPDGNVLASGGYDIKLWDVTTGRPLATLTEDIRDVRRVTFSPNGLLLAAASYGSAIAGVWDVTTQEQLANLDGHNERVWTVDFSPDGKVLASGGSDQNIRLWDTSTWQQVGLLAGHKQSITLIQFSPDGNSLASGGYDREVKIWDIKTNNLRETLKGHSSTVWGLAYSHDGRALASVSQDGTTKIWDMTLDNQVHLIEGTAARDTSLRFNVKTSPDGSIVATETAGNRIRIYDVTTGNEWFLPEEGELNLEISPGGRRLALDKGEKGTIKVQNVPTGEIIHTLDHPSLPTTMAFSTDGKLLAVSCREGTIAVWNMATGERQATFKGLQVATNVAFSPGSSLLAAWQRDDQIMLWNLVTERLSARISCPSNHSNKRLTFSPDGRMLAASSGRETSVFDMPSGKRLARLEGHGGLIKHSGAFSPNGKWFASGADDRNVILWDTTTWQPRFVFKGHKHGIQAVAFTPDGKCLVSADGSGTIRLRWAMSFEDFERVATTRTNWSSIAEFNARRGEFDKAVDAARSAERQSRSGSSTRADAAYYLGFLFVHLGKTLEYDQLCLRTLRDFQETDNVYIATRIATLCAIYPWHGLGHEQAAELADGAMKSVNSAIENGRASPDVLPCAQLAKGMCDYRRGQFASAIDWLQRIDVSERADLSRLMRLEWQDEKRLEALRLLFLAMAHHRDGQTVPAQRLFKHATGMIDEFPTQGTGWENLTFCHVIRKEAETLFGVQGEEENNN